MESSRPVCDRLLGRLPLLLGLAVLALLLAAPGAQAWHGYLKIKKVVVDSNSARKQSAEFDFTVDRQITPPDGPWIDNTVDVPYLSDGEHWMARWDSGGDREPDVPWRRFRITEVAAGGQYAQPLSGYETSFACETPFRWEPSPNYSYKWGVVVGWGAWPPAGPPQSGSGTQVTTELRWDSVAGGYATLCTFTNKRKPTIKVKKVFAGDPVAGTQAVNFAVNGGAVTTASGSSDFVNGSESKAIALATDATATTIAEASGTIALGDYVKTISCTDASDPSWLYSTTTDDADGSWTLPSPLAPGQDVSCTVTNTAKTTPGPPPSGGAGGVVEVGTAGEPGSPAVRRGTARISGTVGCASARYASASVFGRQIARVTFYVNGRKVKTLTSADASGAFRLRYRTRSLKAGTYRVRARVEFRASSGTRPRTLSLQFSRCKARSVRPVFTG